jgi:dolichol-phosphate mannosyltransferase
VEPKITIVVPALNEEKRIESTLREITLEFKGAELIVVSDGSGDKTADVASGFNGVSVIKSPKTEGKGASVVKGLRAASGEIVGFLDADGSFNPKDVKKLIHAVADGADCAIASKWFGKKFQEVGESGFRKISSRVWNMLLGALLGLNISDTQAGAKFMKKTAFEAIDCEFISKGFEFDVELLYRLQKKGFRITEVHIPFKDVADSTFRYKKTPLMLWNLIKIWQAKNQ